VAFTLDVYSHVVPEMQSAAAERIAELIFDSDDPRAVARQHVSET
jgi:hypothetical protein